MKDDVFTVIVNITYSCPFPFFTYEYSASLVNATITLSQGLELLPYETPKKAVDVDYLYPGNSVVLNWTVRATTPGDHVISVTAEGKITGFVDYTYEDRIGGSANTTIYVKPDSTTIVVPYDYSTIQEAINNANEGDTIFVRSGIYYEHIIVDKAVSLIGENQSTTIVDGDTTVGNGFYITANNVSITGFTIQNNGLGEPKDTGNGIYIYGMITNISISNNIILNNTVGVNLRDYPYNISVIGNTMILNAWWGIELDGANENLIQRNIIANSTYGINIEGSSHNIIVENTITNNSYVGVSVHSYSIDNKIFHNNFIDNLNQAFLETATSSVMWDDGHEGNFWSDYDGADLDGDGVGDAPYFIDENNTDNYPLMTRFWNLADIDHDLDVDIFDVVLAARAYGSTPSDPHWNPHCDIAQPYNNIDIFDIVTIAKNYGKKYNA